MNEATREYALYDEEANLGFVELVLACESDESRAEIEEGFLGD